MYNRRVNTIHKALNLNLFKRFTTYISFASFSVHTCMFIAGKSVYNFYDVRFGFEFYVGILAFSSLN